MLENFKKAIFRALCLCCAFIGGGVNGQAKPWRASQFGYAEL